MANFLQLTPENIAQVKNMSWGQALKTDLASGFKPGYTGKGATNLGGYITEGVKSLFGKGPTSGGVGGATPLTRKLALTAMDYAPRFMGSQIAYGAPFAYASGASALQKKLEEQGLTGKGGIYDIAGYDDPMSAGASVEYDFQNQRAQRFKQQQLMNRRKQDMQQRIRQGEAAEAAKQRATADAAAAKQASLQARVTTQANREAKERVSRGEARDYGKTETRASSGWQSSPFNRGGLVNFYRYGGFSG